MKSRVQLAGLTTDKWTEEHNKQIINFLRDPTQQLLVVYIDTQTGLTLKETFPTSAVEELAYFIRSKPEAITRDNIVDRVYFGTLLPNNVSSLLSSLQSMYGPALFENSSWPDSILKRICSYSPFLSSSPSYHTACMFVHFITHPVD